MTKEDVQKMWDIDHKLHLGQSLTKKEKEFYNSNLEKMKEEMNNNASHWSYHVSKLTLV